MKREYIQVESHPLSPFLPEGTRILMLGSFPPAREKWSMEFFYPNWINDMWRLMGLLFFDDRRYFEHLEVRKFNKERILSFCRNRGIALYDVALKVRRLEGNASDKHLEIVTATDLRTLLSTIPSCKVIVATGEKAATIVSEIFRCETPKVGTFVDILSEGENLHFWRMPSTSRAYPLSLEKKSLFYRQMFEVEGIL